MTKCPHCDRISYHTPSCRVVHFRDTLKKKREDVKWEGKVEFNEELWSYPVKNISWYDDENQSISNQS